MSVTVYGEGVDAAEIFPMTGDAFGAVELDMAATAHLDVVAAVDSDGAAAVALGIAAVESDKMVTVGSEPKETLATQAVGVI